MNLRGLSSFGRVTVGAFAVITAAGTGFAQADNSAMRAAYERELSRIREEERTAIIVLRAMGEVAGEPVALASVNGDPAVLVAGHRCLSMDVKEVNLEKKSVTLRQRDGDSLVLVLLETHDFAFPDVSQEALLAEGRREASPHERLNHYREWLSLDWDGKVAMLFHSLEQGIVQNYWAGASSGSSGLLLQKQIADQRKRKLEAFVASLSEEQRALWDTPTQAISLLASREEQKAQAELARGQQRVREKVLETLTPEQLALYDDYKRGFE